MSEAFAGEIRMFSGNFAPRGWANCDGTLLAVTSNPDLFKLIGTTYGGDGVSTFQLPDLRGRIPIHTGAGTGLTARTLGEVVGEETVSLTEGQIPGHLHNWKVSAAAASSLTPQNAALAMTTTNVYDSQSTRLAEMSASTVGDVGRGQPHNNMMPSVGIRFIIALYGDQPSES